MKLPTFLVALFALAACTAPELPEERGETGSAIAGGSFSASVWRTDGDGVRVRAEPTTASGQVGSLMEGQTDTVTCQTRGQMVEGTDIWDYVASKGGFVLDKYLYTGFDDFVPGATRCKGDEPADAPPSSGGSGLATIWGGVAFSETFGFGAPNSLGYYAYGTEYGLDGSEHTGIDIGVPFGTPLYAPAAGTLRCAGNEGPGTAGGGCGFFNDYGNAGGGAIQGVGRIELELDDGTAVILGHSRTCLLRPGQRFAAGQQVGTTGGMNGPHVHIEVRVRSGNTRSGWAIVNPRSVLGS